MTSIIIRSPKIPTRIPPNSRPSKLLISTLKYLYGLCVHAYVRFGSVLIYANGTSSGQAYPLQCEVIQSINTLARQAHQAKYAPARISVSPVTMQSPTKTMSDDLVIFKQSHSYGETSLHRLRPRITMCSFSFYQLDFCGHIKWGSREISTAVSREHGTHLMFLAKMSCSVASVVDLCEVA